MTPVIRSKRFRKDVNKAERSNVDLSSTKDVVSKLLNGVKLDEKYKDHPLRGKYKGVQRVSRPTRFTTYI